MRITFLGNFGVDYSSETHHKKSLEALGHEVIALQETQAGSALILEEALKSEMFVWVHTHGWQTPGQPMANVLSILRANKVPSVTYHLDLWLGLQRQQDLNHDDVYKHIDHFFTVDPKMAEWFNKNTNVKGHYLPAGVFHEEAYSLKPSKLVGMDATTNEVVTEKKYDVIFVGSRGYHPEWPYRPKLLEWLNETYGERFHHFGGDGEGVVRGEALNQLYADTKVVVGDSLVKDFSYEGYWSDRLYETLGRGGFMIFPNIEGLDKEFVIEGLTDDIELATYCFDDFEDLKGWIDYYLEHDDEREAIRRRGHQKVVNNYTYEHRWAQIIKEVFPNG